MAQRSIELGSFAPGVNNRLEPTQLAKKLPDGSMGQYLYGASNVDLNEKGHLKRRAGQTAQVSGQSHSLWADTANAYVVIGATLYAYAPPTSLTPILAGLAPSRLSYSRGADNDVYWSNGSLLRRIVGTTDRPVATPIPNPVPTFTVGAGALPAGTYLLAATSRSIDGESPATPVQAIKVPVNSSITATSPFATCIYMSAPDGDILTLQGTGTTVGIYSHNENASRCMTLNRAVMPPGQIVRHYRGSLLVAQGRMLYISDPYNYGVYNPSRGYIPFPADITVIEATDNGVYICADQTYWTGDLFNDALQILLPYGAVPYTSGRSPNDTHVFWQSQRGLVLADRNSAVKNVQEEALQLDFAESGASFYRERDGMTHVVTSRAGTTPNTAAAGTFMDAEFVRKGTVL